MQRGRRQHDPDPGQTGGDARGERIVRPPLEEDDRPLRRLQQDRFGLPHDADPPCVVECPHHDGKRLGFAALPRSEQRHRVFVGGIDRELESADATNGEDPAANKHQRRCRECFLRPDGARHAVRAGKPELGSAGRAAIGFGVMPTVTGRFVFAQAPVALGKRGHAGPLAVVWHRVDDREARSAVGAGDERILESPVGRVVELTVAGVADGHIRRNRLAAVRLVLAHPDDKAAHTAVAAPLDINVFDLRKRRRFTPERIDEIPQCPRARLRPRSGLPRRCSIPSHRDRGARRADARRGGSPPPAPRP